MPAQYKKTMRQLLAGGLAVAFAAQAANAQTYKVNLRPLNQSGVTGNGSVTLSADQSQLTVRLDISGLEPGQLHVAHVHGNVTNSNAPSESSIPNQRQDSDGDKFVELAEGLVTYGPILITLATNSGGNIDRDGDGSASYSQTFNLNDAGTFDGGFNKTSVIGSGGDLHLREIIVHGLTVPAVGVAPGEVDGSAGYKTVLPVAGGEIGTPGDPLKFRARQ